MDDSRDTSNIRGKSNIVEAERSVLRFLCSGKAEDTSRANACQELAAYKWHDEEHRVVFQALTRVRNADLVPMRAQLAQHATRMGFPDVEWERYLKLPETMIGPIDRQDFVRMIDMLLAVQAEQR